jgi:hypothetical protein
LSNKVTGDLLIFYNLKRECKILEIYPHNKRSA